MTQQKLQKTDQRFLLYKKNIFQHYDEDLMHVSVPRKNLELFKRYDLSFCAEKHAEIWSDRLLFVGSKENDTSWNYAVFDLLMNESRKIRFPKTDQKFIQFYPLTNEFGFIVENTSDNTFGIKRVNFVGLNWDANEFQVIERFEHQCRIFKVIPNKMDSPKFVLYWTKDHRLFNYQICKVVKRKIEFGKIYQSRKNFDYYSNDHLYHGFESGYRFRMKSGNLISKEEQDVEIVLPRKINALYGCEWINDCVYIRFKKFYTEYGIAWTNFATKQWSFLDFKTNIYISRLKFSNGCLIVTAREDLSHDNAYKSEFKVYEIPMKRPQLLRKSAWRLVVRIMKTIGEKNPYEAAKEFLPLNSDLRELWFKDQEILGNREEKMEH